MTAGTDIAWGIQVQVLQAYQAAERAGLKAEGVITWMTLPMWHELLAGIQSNCGHIADGVTEHSENTYCGSSIRFLPGKEMVSVSAHPALLR